MKSQLVVLIRSYLNLSAVVQRKGEQLRVLICVLDHCIDLNLAKGKGKSGEAYNVSAGMKLSTEFRNF